MGALSQAAHCPAGRVTGRASSTNGYIDAALRAIKTPGNEKTMSSSSLRPTAPGWPSLITVPATCGITTDRKCNKENTAYAVAFFYTTGGTIAEATLDNTYRWVDGTGFERQFAATIYIPNVKHYLNVQKVDDNKDPVSGATFAPSTSRMI